jgi:hypothetical protein
LDAHTIKMLQVGVINVALREPLWTNRRINQGIGSATAMFGRCERQNLFVNHDAQRAR